MTAYQGTTPFRRPISRTQLRKYLVITNFCWLVGLVVVCYATISVTKFALAQALSERAERMAQAEHSLELQAEINRQAELLQYTSAQTMDLARSIQSVIDTADGSQRRFLMAILPEALHLQMIYKVPVSATIGQAVYESGYGTSTLAKIYHNYFGIKALGDDWAGEKVGCNTKDLGQTTYANFRSFPDMRSGLEGYATFLRSRDRYAKAFEIRNGAKFVETIAKAGYCPDPDYATKVASIIARHKLTKLDLPDEIPAQPESTMPRVIAPEQVSEPVIPSTVDSMKSDTLVPIAASNAPATQETARN